MPRHRLEQIAARECRARGLDRRLIFAGRVIGKSLSWCFGVQALRGVVRQAHGGFSLPGKIVAQHHAAPGGAVIGQEAIRNIQHDVALVGLARALLQEVLDLEHEVVGESAEQAEQRIVIRREGRDQIAHQRHHAGAAGALVFLDRRGAADDMAGQTGRAFLRNDDAGLAQDVTDKGDQHFAASVQRCQREVGDCGFQNQRRIGKAEVKALVAARYRGARGQHHAAAAIQQVDQIVEPVGATGKLLDGPRDREPARGPVFAVLG